MTDHQATTTGKNGGSGHLQPPKKVKKPYVRIVTEKRRESNRKAQRAFRQRQKQRLDHLEDKIAATRCNFDQVTASRPQVRTTSGAGKAQEDRARRGNLGHEPHESARSADFNTIIFQATGDLPAAADLLGLTPLIAAAPSSSQPSALTAKLPFIPSASTSLGEDDESDPNVPYSWPMPTKSHTEQYNPPSPSPSPSPSRRHASRHQQRALNSANHSSSSTWPWFNTLTPGPHSAINASLALASVLRISRTAYLNDAPSSFPSCFLTLLSSPRGSVHDVAYLPPYTKTYHPATSSTPAAAAGAESAVLAKVHADPGVRGRFDEHASILPETLRPSPVQYLRAHPSYLDCIVWPRMRERAVQASVKGELDHVEFFLDLMHGGMVCWGGGVGGEGGGGRGARGWGDDVPWSTRSWEAKGWFLRKWQWLIGSEEEEVRLGDRDGVWSSSRWWWKVRAEQEGLLRYGGGVGDASVTDYDDDAAAAKDWAEGQVQELGEGAWSYDLDEPRRTYVPMSSMRG